MDSERNWWDDFMGVVGDVATVIANSQKTIETTERAGTLGTGTVGEPAPKPAGSEALSPTAAGSGSNTTVLIVAALVLAYVLWS